VVSGSNPKVRGTKGLRLYGREKDVTASNSN